MMKKWNNINVILIALWSLCNTSCYTHWQSEIVVVNNNTGSAMLVAKLLTDQMTDSILCNEIFSKNEVRPFSSQVIAIPDVSLNNSMDSEKVYLFIFNIDSLNKYKKLKIKNIIKHCLVKKNEIQLNLVKQPIDTLFIK